MNRNLRLDRGLTRTDRSDTDHVPLSLADIVEALCAGISPGQPGLEKIFDRIERTS